MAKSGPNPEDTASPSLEGVADAPESAEKDDKYQALYDQFLRLQADFDNFRKRTEQERESLIKFGVEQSVTRLLSVFDNLERGLGTLNENSDSKTLYKGFQLMHKELSDGFAAVGLERVKTVGEDFNPQFHEAVGHIESNEHPENRVARELRPGFMLKDKVLRPALVQVSTGPVTTAQVSTAENPFKEGTPENAGTV